MTADIAARAVQHREGKGGSFTHRYGLTRLVYLQRYDDITDAIAREKAVKGVMRRVADETLEGWDTMGGDADGASEPSFLRDAEEQLQALDLDDMSSVSVVSSMAHLPVNAGHAAAIWMSADVVITLG